MKSRLTVCLSLLISVAPALAQAPKTLEERVRELESFKAAVSEEVFKGEFGKLAPQTGAGRFGMGRGAAKVYDKKAGVSLGGYGEFLFEDRFDAADRFDALRAILYFGYRFDENWVFNSEIEIEHGSTSASSGTTTSGGSVSLEFGYLEYLHNEQLNARAGLLLVPMGFINELHEPTAFLGAHRPETERRIIPSTWREMGVGVHGRIEGFDYKLYVINGLNGEKFSSSGLRGGRQKGNRAAAQDLAVVARVDYIEQPGLIVGLSFYCGQSGQDSKNTMSQNIPDLGTAIVEVHAQYEAEGLRARGLWAAAFIDDTVEFNRNTNNTLAKFLSGHYLELGFDVMSRIDPESGQALTPYLRYERVDTQASVADAFVRDGTKDEVFFTFGVEYKPRPNIVIKLDFRDSDEGNDSINLLFGYDF